jgi:hypothetical protein
MAFERALSLEPIKSKQQIVERQKKKGFGEQSFSLGKERYKWKPWKTRESKSRKFLSLPLFHMQFTRT